MRLPTFIIPGAPKAGTSALWAYLNEHPEVSMTTHKEPRFFSMVQGELEKKTPGDGPARSGNFGRGFKWYSGLFEEKESARAWGEASTHYFSAPDSPEMIREHVPEVRLIIMVRDPVWRLYSHYWQEFKLGWELPPFSEMVRANHPRFRFYCDVSAYRRHIEEYLARFPRERILVLLDSDLRSEPLEFYRRVCTFIGVSTDFVPSTLGRSFNQQTVPRFRSFQRWRIGVQSSWVGNLVPNGVRTAAGRVLKFLTRMNSVANTYEPLDSATRAALVPRFEEDTRFVEGFLGRSLDAWRKV